MDLDKLEIIENNNEPMVVEEHDFDQITVDDSLLYSPIGVPGNVDLSDKEKEELTTLIYDYIRQVEEEDKAGFNDEILEGERMLNTDPDTNIEKPWDTSCEYESTLVPSHCATISNSLVRTIEVEPPIIARVKGSQDKSKLLTDFANDIAKNSFGFRDALGRLSDIASQTPGAIINPEWLRDVRRDSDYEVFTSVDGFTAKFKTAEDAGLTEGEYNQEIKFIEKNIEKHKFHVCRYEYDVVTDNRCVWNIIHPSDFVMYPWNSLTPNLARLVGARVYESFDNFVSFEQDCFIYPGSSNAIKKAYVSNESISNPDNVKNYQDSVNGIPSDLTLDGYRSKNYQTYRGLLRIDIGDGVKDYEYIIVYDEKVLVRFAPSRYDCKERNYFIASILPKTKSAWGISLPKYLKNTASIVTTMIRQLIDSNTISNVPTFKGSFSDREWLERTNQGMKFKPGKVFWLKGPGQFERFSTDPVNGQQVLMIVQYLEQNAETMTGASRSLAGQPIADDPNAPGIKQAMMIQQSNFMVNRYISNIRQPLGKAIKFTVKLYRQYLFLDKYSVESINTGSGRKETKDIARDDLLFLDDITSFDIRNSKVDDNVQLTISNMLADANFLLAIQQINQNPLAVRTIVRNTLMKRDYYTLDEVNDIVGSEEKIRADVQAIAADVATSEQAGAMREEMTKRHTEGMEGIQNKLDNIVMGGNTNGTEEQGNVETGQAGQA